MKTIFIIPFLFMLLGFSVHAQIFNNQLQIIPNSIVAPTALKTPIFMQDTLVFGASIANRGLQKATNVKLTVNVKDPFGINKFSATQNFGTLLPDSMVQYKPFVQKYVPLQCSVGKWTVGYKVTSDSIDQNPLDDTASLTLIRTDTILQNYHQDTQIVAFFPKRQYHPTEPLNWGIGMVFKTPLDGSRLMGFDVLIPAQKNAQTLFGRHFTIALYSWTDRNNDGLVQLGERLLVGAGESNSNSSPPTLPTWLKVPCLSIPGNKNFVNLRKDSTYIAMIQWVSTLRDSIYFAVDTSFSTEVSLKNYRLANQIRYSSLLSTTEDPIEGTYTTTVDTFGNNISKLNPIMRAWIKYSGMDCFNPIESLEDEYSITLSPNPADTETFLDINFEEQQSHIWLKIVDVNGQIVLTKEVRNIEKYQWMIPLSNLQSGLYFLQIQTTNWLKTKRFVVFR